MTDLGITRRDDCIFCGSSQKEMDRLASIEFAHQACRMLREKDNEYLIEQRDILQRRIDRAMVLLNDYLDGEEAARARDILLGFS